MIGYANEVKTLLVNEVGGTPFDSTLNLKIKELGYVEIVDIQFRANPDIEGVIWYSALVIYKEEV
ncbi:hypothetical protein [Paenibacillus odorifer]|uniref:hypothetical protein n=1 Tax=Paenibacillus odorifer TaxID=189426 RepID=UPI0009701676|nr:hypothetical protein [Paenibacillus odorifer]OMD08367.1 hypothetical protein BJP50_07190 [Paenibacillus odorifer]